MVTLFSRMLGKYGRRQSPLHEFIRNNRSSVVEKVLLRAHAQRKNFSVIVADSRPLLEGESSYGGLGYIIYGGFNQGKDYCRP